MTALEEDQLTTVVPVAVDVGRTPRRRGPTLNALLIAGLVLAALLVLIAILAPMLLGARAQELTDQVRLGPSWSHPLGTDEFGRDLLARSLVATRFTLLLALSAAAISVVSGILIGTAVWLLPARLRHAALAANSIAVAFPTFVLALIVAAILGPGARSAVIAIGLAGIPGFVRLTANIAAPLVSIDYVRTARLLRVPEHRVMARHVLPNMAEPLLILSAGHFALVLMELSGLSFIGLGVQSPEYDFGKLLSDGLVSIYSQPTQIVGPALMLMLTGLSAMLIGDGLAARSNPRVSRDGRKAPSGGLRRDGAGVPGEEQRGDQGREAVVTVRDLRIRTDLGTELVKGVSFSIHAGEIVGLVGESGSGKSLTAMSMAGLVPEGVEVTAGVLSVAGNDLLGTVDPRALAKDIALVYQDPVSTFNPVLSLGTQLTEVARTHLGMPPSVAREALAQKFEELHISRPRQRIRQRSYELSGGMLQRAMIASALLADARVVVADEPTTALDVTVQADVLRQIHAASRSIGASVLFISHDLGVVEALCDRVLVMYAGEIVEELSTSQLGRGAVEHPYTRRLLAAASYVEG